jgi:hypothetical protein
LERENALIDVFLTLAARRSWRFYNFQRAYAQNELVFAVGPNVRFGSRLCENFNVRRARRNIFEKLRDMRTDNAADIRLNAMLGNCIFYISPMYEFSHSLGHNRTMRLEFVLSAVPPKPDIASAFMNTRPS